MSPRTGLSGGGGRVVASYRGSQSVEGWGVTRCRGFQGAGGWVVASYRGSQSVEGWGVASCGGSEGRRVGRRRVQGRNKLTSRKQANRSHARLCAPGASRGEPARMVRLAVLLAQAPGPALPSCGGGPSGAGSVLRLPACWWALPGVQRRRAGAWPSSGGAVGWGLNRAGGVGCGVMSVRVETSADGVSSGVNSAAEAPRTSPVADGFSRNSSEFSPLLDAGKSAMPSIVSSMLFTWI